MSVFRSAGIYTLANAFIAVTALVMTLELGRQLGPDNFGIWASFFAAQNIWASMGFMRLETRLSACTSIHQANRIIYAGFLVGLLVSAVVTFILLILLGSTSYIWLAVLSGFGLSVFDVLSQRNAYEGREIAVLIARSIRILLPILTSLSAALSGLSITGIIDWHGFMVIIFAMVAWGRWMTPYRWWKLSVVIIKKYLHNLLPSVIMCLLNGIWINGLTPTLNHITTSEMAGQFAMVQRLVGGALGLLSAAITLIMLKRDFLEVYWPTVRKIITINLIISLCICLLLSYPLMYEPGRWLGVGWSVTPSMYFAACAFLISSFAIGAISVIAIRLDDEWFLALWQIAALLCWVVIYTFLPPKEFLIPALWFGSAMYILLGLRWRHLATQRRENA